MLKVIIADSSIGRFIARPRPFRTDEWNRRLILFAYRRARKLCFCARGMDTRRQHYFT
jgi:hypothetical protein